MLSMRPEDLRMCETSEKGERLFSRDEIMSVNFDIGQRILEIFGNQDVSNIVFRLRSTRNEINAILDGMSLPSCEILLGIQRLTGVSIDWLLTGEGDRFPVRIARPSIEPALRPITHYPPMTQEMPMIRAA